MKKISLITLFLSFVISTQIGLSKDASYSLATKSESDEKKEAEDYSLLDIYNSGLINVINKFKTYSQDPITFNEDERIMLTSSTTHRKFNVKGKEKVLVKFNNKIQEIKCTNAAIAHTVLQRSKDIINVLINSERERVAETMFFYKLKNYLARMLSVLYIAETVAPKWLCLLYFRVYGVVDAETEEITVPDANYLLDNNQLYADISKCKDMCVEDLYLDEYYIGINSLDVPIRSVDDVEVLMDRLFMPNDHADFKDTYRHQHDFAISNLYLQEFWDKHEFLFEKIPNVQIDWSATKELLNAANVLMKNHVETRMWVKQPLRASYYMEFLVDIMKVRLYVHSWIHLAAYRKVNATCSKEHSVKLTYYHFYLGLKSIAEMVCYKDDFMKELIDFFDYYYSYEIDSDEITAMSKRIEKTARSIMKNFYTSQWSLTDDFDDKAAVNILEDNSAALHVYLENIQKILHRPNIVLTSYFLKQLNYIY